MTTNPTPYTLGPEDGEAFWGFGALWTLKASAEQTGGRFSLIEEVRRFTPIRRTTRRSTSLKESLRSTSMTASLYRHPLARLFIFLEELCMRSR
jgi:hypothetical protein